MEYIVWSRKCVSGKSPCIKLIDLATHFGSAVHEMGLFFKKGIKYTNCYRHVLFVRLRATHLSFMNEWLLKWYSKCKNTGRSVSLFRASRFKHHKHWKMMMSLLLKDLSSILVNVTRSLLTYV